MLGFGGLGGAPAAAPAAAPPPAQAQVPIAKVRRIVSASMTDDAALAPWKSQLVAFLHNPYPAAPAASTGADPPTSRGPPAALEALKWLLDQKDFPDDAMDSRPNHRDLLASLLKAAEGNLVGNLTKHVLGRLVPMGDAASVSSPPHDCLHAAAALVMVTQRWQLHRSELEGLLQGLYCALAAMRCISLHDLGAQEAAVESWSAARPTHVSRSPPDSIGGVLEDTAYLLATAVMNAVRLPLPEACALWRRESGTRGDGNAFVDDADVCGYFENLLGCGNADPAGHVFHRVGEVGAGDRRAREFAAGYLGMVLAGAHALLARAGRWRPEEAWAERQSLMLHYLEMHPPPAVGSAVYAEDDSLTFPQYELAQVQSVDSNGLFRVRFSNGGWRSDLPRNKIMTPKELGLQTRCWLRARTWFPSFYSTGLSCPLAAEVLQQCILDCLDSYLAVCLDGIVTHLVPEETQEYSRLLERVRQTRRGYGGGGVGQQWGGREAGPPLLSSVEDVLRLVAFLLGPPDFAVPTSCAPPPPARKEELAEVPLWKLRVSYFLLRAWRGSTDTEREGLVELFSYCRGTTKKASPLHHILDQNLTGHSATSLDDTACSLLAAYLDLCRSLCVDEEATQELFFCMMGDMTGPAFSLALPNLVTKPDSHLNCLYRCHFQALQHGQAVLQATVPVVASTATSAPITPQAEEFLCSAIALVSACVDSTQPSSQETKVLSKWSAERGDAEVRDSLSLLFKLLSQPLRTRRAGGHVLNAISGWCNSHLWTLETWDRLYTLQVLPVHGLPGPTDAVFRQERESLTYPHTIGCLRVVLRILTTVDWRQLLRQHEANGSEPVQIGLAGSHVNWILREVFQRLEESSFKSLTEKWTVALLCLRIIRASLRIPDAPTVDPVKHPQTTRPQEYCSPAMAVWNLALNGELVSRIMQLCFQCGHRGATRGPVMCVLLFECLETIRVLLVSPESALEQMPLPQFGGQRPASLLPMAGPVPRLGGGGLRKRAGSQIAKRIAEWRDGHFIIALSSREWHNIPLDRDVGALCVRILVALSQAQCRLSHCFIRNGRGRTEDDCREAQQTLLVIARRAYDKLKASNGPLATALDAHVLRRLHGGTRVQNLVRQIEQHLIAPLTAGQTPEDQHNAVRARNCAQVFVNNKAEELQVLFAELLESSDGTDPPRSHALICQLLETSIGNKYYNLAHIICGVPERYVESQLRGMRGMADEDVFRSPTDGVQRRTALTVIIERLTHKEWVGRHPFTAMRFYTTLQALARDACIGRAVLHYLRNFNVVQIALGDLTTRIRRLPSLYSGAPATIAAEVRTCSAIMHLASLDLVQQSPNGAAQWQTLNTLLVGDAAGPLLLEAARRVASDQLPRPQQIDVLLAEGGAAATAAVILITAPSGAVCDEEDIIDSVELPSLAAQLRTAFASRDVYHRMCEYAEAWSSLVEVVLGALVGATLPETDSGKLAREQMDGVMFQAVLDIVPLIAADLRKTTVVGPRGTDAALSEVSAPHLLAEVPSFVAKARAVADLSLSHAAFAIIDGMSQRVAEGAAPPGSPGQLCGLLSSLLDAVCDAVTDPDLRLNLYCALVSLLGYVESGAEMAPAAGWYGSGEAHAARLRMIEEFRRVLLSKLTGVMQRIAADIGAFDTGALRSAAWTALAQLVVWDEQGVLEDTLRSTSLISQQLADYDDTLRQVLQRGAQGDASLDHHMQGFSSFTAFLLAYASTADGASALVQQHQLLRGLAHCRFLGECAQQQRLPSELAQERCSAILLPVVRLVAEVARGGPEHLVAPQVRDFLGATPGLCEHLLRPPYNLGNATNGIDMDSLRLLEAATGLLAAFVSAATGAGGSSVGAADLWRLPQQYHALAVLGSFGCRRAWEPQLMAGRGVGAAVDAARSEAGRLISEVLHNVLSFLRAVVDAVASSAVDAAQSPTLFELTIQGPVSAATNPGLLARGDLTVLLCILSDVYSDAEETLVGGAAQPPHRVRALQRGHASAAEAMLLLAYHLRPVANANTEELARLRSQAHTHLPQLLAQTERYANTLQRYAPPEMRSADSERLTMRIRNCAKVISDLTGCQLS